MHSRPRFQGRELRSSGSFLDVRTGYDGGQKLVGHCAVFNALSCDLGGFCEIIRPGAFSRAIKEKQDVKALFNHDPNLILGRTKSGSLRLHEDTHGLAFELILPSTSLAFDLSELVSRGDLDAMSFSFSAARDSWSDQKINGKNVIIRELLDLNLHDVSVSTFASYESAKVTVQRARSERLEMTLFPEKRGIRALRNEVRRLEIQRLLLQYGGRY